MKQHKTQTKAAKAIGQQTGKLVTTDRVPQGIKPFPKVASSIPQLNQDDKLCFVRGYN